MRRIKGKQKQSHDRNKVNLFKRRNSELKKKSHLMVYMLLSNVEVTLQPHLVDNDI